MLCSGLYMLYIKDEANPIRTSGNEERGNKLRNFVFFLQ